MNKVPLIKPTLMGKKTIFKTDTIPTKGSNNIVTSDALAQALQDKVVNKEEEGEKTIVPTGDIIIGKLLEDGFYIKDPTFLGTRLIKIETPTPGKFYYDKTTHTYYTFQGYNETGYNFKPVVLPNLMELTWQELKDLRDDSKLIPGSLYRITDYQCTTTQNETQSAGHQFDIVLLALSENKLAEEGWVMHHANDTYFANSNLSAWKVWYCLDNNKVKYSWADTTNGKGVIYRLIDEWGNDCPYDFKNIQYRYPLTNGLYDYTNGTNTWVYTFNAYNVETTEIGDGSMLNGTIINDDVALKNCTIDNVIEAVRYRGYDLHTMFTLPYNCYLGLISSDSDRPLIIIGFKTSNSSKNVIQCSQGLPGSVQLVDCDQLKADVSGTVKVFNTFQTWFATLKNYTDSIYYSDKKVLTES